MTKTLKRLFLIKDLPIFIEAGDETEAIMLFETAMQAVQREGYDNLEEAIESNQQQRVRKEYPSMQKMN